MSVAPIPAGYRSVTPYLVLHDLVGFLAFAERALGAEVVERIDLPEGGLAHAAIQIGDSRVMVGAARPDSEPFPAMLYVYVPDVDAAFARAVEAGAKVVVEPADQFYGDRSGGLEDEWGVQWWLATHVEDVPPEELAQRMAAQRGS